MAIKNKKKYDEVALIIDNEINGIKEYINKKESWINSQDFIAVGTSATISAGYITKVIDLKEPNVINLLNNNTNVLDNTNNWHRINYPSEITKDNKSDLRIKINEYFKQYLSPDKIETSKNRENTLDIFKALKELSDSAKKDFNKK